MAIEFTMPKLGLTMEEGTIVEWLVASDTSVNAGSAVLVIDTDKTQTEVEIPDSGRLVLIGEVGQTYACGDLIGYVLGPGEEVPVGTAKTVVATPAGTDSTELAVVRSAVPSTSVGDSGRVLASPYARVRAKELGIDLGSVVGSGPGGRIVAEDIENAPKKGATSAPMATAATRTPSGIQQPITYAADQLARLVGLDLSTHTIRPTSPDGRISREDVAGYIRGLLASGGTGGSGNKSTPPPAASQTPASVVPLKGMRGTIAQRMSASLRDMAQLTLMMDVDMDAVVADREGRKRVGGAVPSFTDYVIAASARALREHPRVNSQITPDGIALLPQVNVGMAVALDEGLIVPVVPNTDTMGIEELSTHTSRLAAAARSGTLKLPELEGGTFSVSTLGMFGVDGFTPVINPPNCAILGVGRLRDDAAWSDDGALRRVKRLTLSLTWDHRVLDGAPAAEFVRTITHYLDDPTTLA